MSLHCSLLYSQPHGKSESGSRTGYPGYNGVSQGYNGVSQGYKSRV